MKKTIILIFLISTLGCSNKFFGGKGGNGGQGSTNGQNGKDGKSGITIEKKNR